MKITFLGTGTSQGVPIIGSDHPVCLSSDPRDKRLRVSVLVEWDDYRYVVDCGPDFRQQMLRAGVSRIDGILFTHEHADHTMGLDDIRPFFFRQGDIPIYAHTRVLGELRQRFPYIFVNGKDKYPGAPGVRELEVTNNHPVSLGNMKVVPVNVMHNRLQVFGYRFGDFAYLTDVKTIAEEEIRKVEGVKILVINALRIKPHPSHLNLEEALKMVEKIQPGKAYFTHISHLLGFHEEVERSLPENVFLAYDNLEVEI
ncbi:MBL fold metallo-hydrolase [Sinomicrobium sp. M5D2P17]